ncbi:lytic transglycosylase [Erythrobacter sp. QSSC1-22B]|uniref:transglycosylase SLT domain-containing protein n=1 Tax=Erythrobacter sp. QSSC1-22B TaxID=1860125 RepID=UPI000804C636|nr:transglycosylase SLT domain-containing protein [Erythrobacter sp. QSSC1-22B]OBX18852.1 lytic transglycosylase [Erythrobacter sp. QSSC1-22B]
MPTVNSVQHTEVQAAIARASVRTGVDFNYLLAQAKLESGLDPQAKAGTSSATGLFQFIDSTWTRMVDRHGSKHGMEWADQAIGPGGRIADPATRAQVMSLRYDADASSLMAAELARENADGLRVTLGREPEPSELYLAHFLGLGGAQKFLGALGANPDQSAVALMPQPARANRPIFYDGGRARSVGEVMAVMRDKVASAYGDSPMPSGVTGAPERFAAFAAQGNFGQHGFSGSAGSSPALPAAASRPSMSETLKSTFGNAGAPMGGRASETIATAYGKLRAFGL